MIQSFFRQDYICKVFVDNGFILQIHHCFSIQRLDICIVAPFIIALLVDDDRLLCAEYILWCNSYLCGILHFGDNRDPLGFWNHYLSPKSLEALIVPKM